MHLPTFSRRDMLRWAGAAPLAIGVGARAASAGRILVVLELSGANDGLNTVVPYTDDHYRRLRPKLAIPAAKVRKLDDRFGLNPGMAGFERLYKDGRVAIVHGCGYAQPSFSHFTSMAYWHTAAPNRGDEYGWMGRLADRMQPEATPGFVINIDSSQSLAVKSARHTPVVFDAPERFVRNAPPAGRALLDALADVPPGPGNASRAWLADVARGARDTSALVREAWARYRTPVDYGLVPIRLNKVAAMIEAGLPARLYHVAYGNNAFDTHVQQADLHQRLLTYVSDAVSAFMRDLQRIGRADDVLLMVFSEFGRRVPENANAGTDHGTANVMFLVGPGVKGGHHGAPPDLGALDAGDNMNHTTDFRRVYASAIGGWLGADARAVLKGDFEPLPVFG